MDAIRQSVADDLAAVNALIIRELHSDVDLVENIGHYIVEGGGKRARPLLVLLTANTLGACGENHIALAAVIEFIHTATLLHDDVVDVSALRRGRATANARWGNAPSVLVGDFIYSRAFQLLVRMADSEILALLADTTNRIAEGEVLQLQNVGDPDIAEADYYEVIERKTAILFQAASLGAAILARADAATRAASARFGYHLGMAFQIADDVLDYCGSADEMGKNVGDDLAEGKATLPLLRAMATVGEGERELIHSAIAGKDSSRLAAIIDAVKSSGAIDYCRERAHHHVRTAVIALQALPEGDHRTQLHRLVESAADRIN